MIYGLLGCYTLHSSILVPAKRAVYLLKSLYKKVKCTLVQALRLCTDRTVRTGSRNRTLLFLDHGTRRGEGSASRPATLYHQERPGTHCEGGWLGPRAGLDRCGKSRLTGIRSSDRPGRSQSLYRLSYPAHVQLTECGSNSSLFSETSE